MSGHLVYPPAPPGVPQSWRAEADDPEYDAWVEAWRFYGQIFDTATDANRQLTFGDDVYDVVMHDAAECDICRPFIGPLFVASLPNPCTCEYVATLGPRDFEVRHGHNPIGQVAPFVGTAFIIKADCPHHGDRPW